MEVSGELHASGAQWVGSWSDPRTDLDAVKKKKVSARNQTTIPQLSSPWPSDSFTSQLNIGHDYLLPHPFQLMIQKVAII
jgi:hypothetical protein